MIIRARPKYLREDYLLKEGGIVVDEREPDDELFFNLGRSALKFFLIHYASFKNKTIRVALQSFNCEVIYEGVKEAGCIIELYDNNLHDFSASLDEIKQLNRLPDVLILTHYQGIPNTEYEAISQYCRENEIFLLDDMAHTEGSKINNVPIGKLSGAAIHSFAFDKPFTTFKGGSLSIENIKDSVLKQRLLEAYGSLKKESSFTMRRHKKALLFLMRSSSPDSYSKEINNYNFIELLFALGLSSKAACRILKWDFSFSEWRWKRFYPWLSGKNTNMRYKVYHKIRLVFTSLWNRFLVFLNKTGLFDNRIRILKMHKEKLSLLLAQKKIYDASYSDLEKDFLEKLFVNNNVKIASYPNSNIRWNRYSILDEEGKIYKILDSNEIEFRNYNWYRPLHLIYEYDKTGKSLSNAELTSKKIVNLPLWSDYFKTKAQPLN